MKTLIPGFTALTLALTGPGFAELDAAKVTQVQLVEDIGAAERIEAAALLRVLSQEAASAACHMVHDINPAESRDLMVKAKTKFHILLDALQHGNPEMNIIGGETRRKTVMKIEALREAWQPIFDAAVVLLEDPHDADALKLIKANNEAVLASASLLTSELAGEYSNPTELMQADVMLLDFSGRQAMLTQKMAKIACEIWAGNRGEDRLTLLSKIMQTYELTLNALLNGMPAVGILAAPNDDIKAALTKATTDWVDIKAELNIVMADDDVTDAIKAKLFHDLNVAMYDMEHIEHLYVTYSKHNYDTPALEEALLD